METNTAINAAIDEMTNRSLGSIKVLMIEDDTFLSDLVLTKLSAEGCVPYSAETADEGISLAREFKPSVIILDLMLPGKSGEETIKILKTDTELKNIPVIVFSNKSEPETVDNLMQLGAERYLVKSATDTNHLSDIVKEVALK